MVIQRQFYIDQLIDAAWDGHIKIITGIRRCGKSFLLFNLFYEHLISTGVTEDEIITISLDNDEYSDLVNPHKLMKYIKERTQDKTKKYYCLIDEIQQCKGFEAVLNGLLRQDNLDVYVTGSNSKLLSKDVITEFRGRGFEIRVYPLSFSEMSTQYDDKSKALSDYFLYGGMPQTLSYQNDNSKRNYLSSLFKTVYLADIKERYNIEHLEELDRIIDSLSSSIGSLTNPNKITNTLVSNQRKGINYRTVRDYLEYITDAFLFEKVDRYDVKGKKYFDTISKYYCVDLGLRNAKLNFRQHEETHLMENAIYLELVQRGYSVDVGIVEVRQMVDGIHENKKLEIDFVVNRADKRYYIQSAYYIPDKEKEDQEKRPFRAVNDSFKKILIVRNDYYPTYYDDDGILHMGLLDFLSNPNSLDL